MRSHLVFDRLKNVSGLTPPPFIYASPPAVSAIVLNGAGCRSNQRSMLFLNARLVPLPSRVFGRAHPVLSLLPAYNQRSDVIICYHLMSSFVLMCAHAGSPHAYARTVEKTRSAGYHDSARFAASARYHISVGYFMGALKIPDVLMELDGAWLRQY